MTWCKEKGVKRISKVSYSIIIGEDEKITNKAKKESFKEVLKEVISTTTSLKYHPAITEREILKRSGILQEKYYHTLVLLDSLSERINFYSKHDTMYYN